MTDTETILHAALGKRQDILRAIVAGHATPGQKRAYKAMKRDADRRAARWE